MFLEVEKAEMTKEMEDAQEVIEHVIRVVSTSTRLTWSPMSERGSCHHAYSGGGGGRQVVTLPPLMGARRGDDKGSQCMQ